MFGSRNSITKEGASPVHRSNKSSMLSDQDDDYDNRSRSGSILSNSSFLSDSSFVSDSGSTDGSKSKKNRKITNPTVKFVSESQWVKNKHCIVCERKIEKLKGVTSHHCRICGYGVCGDCSKGRVNGNRTCDVCFRKVEIEPHEKRREDIVKSKTERVVKANDILKKRGTDADQCLKRINTVMEEISAGKERFTKGFEKYTEEKEQMESHLKKTKETVDVLKRNVETNRDIIHEKEEKLREVLDKLKELKRELENNKRELTESQSLYEDKRSQLNVLQQTKIAIESTKKHEPQPNESIAESDKVSFISDGNRDFTSEKDGQYNISLQPVNI